MKFKPRNYQRKAIKFLLEKGHAGLFQDPGMGKTSEVLAAFKILRAEGLINRALIIAPLRVCHSVWPKEVRKWDDFRDLRIHVLHGKGRDLDAKADIYCINPEGLGWLFVELSKRKRWPFEWLVVDESTRFKHTNTQRFRLLKNHLAKFLRRTILTGTPTPNGLLDLFGQMFVVDSGKSLGRFITHFRNEFFFPSGYGGYEWKLQRDAEARIMARVKPVTLSMAAEDYLELPERVDNTIEVDLPEEVMRKYRELEREMIVQLESKTLVAASAGVVSMKCRQVANGGVYVDGPKGRETVQLHDAKVDALESLVEELGGSPLLVAYEFGHDLERIRARFGKKTPAIHGGMAVKESLRLEAAWNAGDLPMLLAQPQTVAHGLNLQESGFNIAWFGLIWDWEVHHQFNLRVLRQGQRSKRVFIHHIIANDTVDKIIYEALRDKHRDQKSFLNGLKAKLYTRIAA